jgi:NAD(P)H-nitrite reductase large subunit
LQSHKFEKIQCFLSAFRQFAGFPNPCFKYFIIFTLSMQHIIIIGNGIAGATAARHIRKLSNHRITMISSESKHFYSRTALMYIYMGHMKYEHTKPYEDAFWEKNRIDLRFDHVIDIDFRYKELKLRSGESLRYDQLILAVGSKPNYFGWKGQELYGVSAMVNLQDLQRIEEATKGIQSAVIVGGGLIGIEMAEMMRSRGIHVHFLVREKSFWDVVLPAEESEMINRHIREHEVDLHLQTELLEITSDERGHVKSVITKEGKELACQFVGIATGVSPNIDWLKGSLLKTNRGIMVNEYCETSQPDVYAIGDCAEFIESRGRGRKTIEQVWYTGRMMGEVVAHSVCGNRTKYEPSHWFNSAKFFDIEYQVYGLVNPRPDSALISLYWEHPAGKKSIRLVAERTNQQLIGINLMGVRFRHELAERMLIEAWPLKKVVEQFDKGQFDAEFTPSYRNDLVEVYNGQFPENPITLKKKFLFW